MLGSRASTQGKKPCNSTVNGRCALLERSPHRDKIILGMFPGEMRSMQTYRVEGNEENFLKYFK